MSGSHTLIMELTDPWRLAARCRDPVQGCQTFRLGALRYTACASPDFIARFFAGGVTGDALAKAPYLRFDWRDGLQAQWARQSFGVDFEAPHYTVASAHAFVDFALAGLVWGMQPIMLAEPHIAAGRLVGLAPVLQMDVTLYSNQQADSLRARISPPS